MLDLAGVAHTVVQSACSAYALDGVLHPNCLQHSVFGSGTAEKPGDNSRQESIAGGDVALATAAVRQQMRFAHNMCGDPQRPATAHQPSSLQQQTKQEQASATGPQRQGNMWLSRIVQQHTRAMKPQHHSQHIPQHNTPCTQPDEIDA